MKTYETQEMTRSEAIAFTTWHSNTIGTEYELYINFDSLFKLSKIDEVNAYVMAFDMLPIEIGLCRAWEQSHTPAPTNKDIELGRVNAQGWVLQ